MQVPVRLVTLLRPEVQASVLASVGVATFVFSATPFVLGAIADRYDVGLGLAASISTLQLAGFGLAAYGAGRLLSGRRHVFPATVAVLVVANAASALLPPFAVLVALRFLAGLAMGVASWIAWGIAFGSKKGTTDVSMVGPLMGVISAPLLAPAFALGGIRGTYGLLAVVAVAPLVLNPRVSLPPTAADVGDGRRSRPVPAALVVLLALALFTMGGSSVWVFTGVFAEERGLALNLLAWSYSANAVAGVISSRWSGPRGPAGFWMAITGAMAFIVAAIPSGTVQMAAGTVWGFGFWMAMPAAFEVLARKSRFPEERAGDAQAVMAAGRVVGPVLGGVIIDLGGARTLGALAVTIMVVAGGLLLAAEQGADADQNASATS